MTYRGLFLAAAALAALLLPRIAVAQSGWIVSLAPSGATQTVHSDNDAAHSRLEGSLVGGEAMIGRDRVALRLRYGQGRVTTDTGAMDVVAGEVILGYRPLSWLGLWVGPRARTFVTDGFSDRRWLLWSAAVAARGAIFPGIESYVEVWQGFSGTHSRPAASASGGGVEAGFEARLRRVPLWLRVGYQIEQGRVSGGRRDTGEAVTLTVGYALLR